MKGRERESRGGGVEGVIDWLGPSRMFALKQTKHQLSAEQVL